ncbi:17-beta-hydroxysteroid dehydrogenase type 6 [Galendromus occidentalis]|uniref:17-beta-hydroxysteroid dehydrogenase type 6 n=1 Tax=Galendromus occidentalis TaxID=34638 RepID=A0AAJ6QUI5_9ACAR|nr:17-beta-hydroxysteroid dehydrogenase type 6 [Galendromus occidentalis]
MVLDSWYRPSGISSGWLNLNHMLLLSFVIFKLIHLSRNWLPIWDVSSYAFVLAFSCWFGFVTYRWLKRHPLASTIASYKKAVLISGCDSDLGNILARRLAHRGFRVLAGCSDPESPQAMKLQSISRVDVLSLDVTNQNSLDDTFRLVEMKLEESENDLWAVVALENLMEIGEMEWLPVDKMQRMLNVNVMGSVRMVKTFLRLLRKSRGRVVISSSAFGDAPFPGLVGYSVSQAAVSSLGRGLKRELAQWDIDVSVVQPSLYDTGLSRIAERKTSFMREDLLELPEQLRGDYGHDYFIGFWNAMNRFVTDNANPRCEEAVSELVRAITTVWPETLYRAGSWRQVLFHNLLDYLPLELADFSMELLIKNQIEPEAVVAPAN